MINKKAQSAMEYLMTYGWAILVVLIALGALFYLGVFNPKTPNACTITAPFSCQDVKGVTGANGLTLRLGASGVNAITYTPATAIQVNGAACAITADGDGDALSPATTMKSSVVSVTCSPGLAVGQKFSGTVTFIYDTGSGVTHTVQGQFSGITE